MLAAAVGQAPKPGLVLTLLTHLALDLLGMLARAELAACGDAACDQRRRDKAVIRQPGRLPAAGAHVGDAAALLGGRQQGDRVAPVIGRPALEFIDQWKGEAVEQLPQDATEPIGCSAHGADVHHRVGGDPVHAVLRVPQAEVEKLFDRWDVAEAAPRVIGALRKHLYLPDLAVWAVGACVVCLDNLKYALERVDPSYCVVAGAVRAHASACSSLRRSSSAS